MPALDDLSDDLYLRAGAARWAVSRERFAAALRASCAHRFPPQVAADAVVPEADSVVSDGASVVQDGHVRAYLDGLHVADLALAVACRDGHAPAWEHFLADVLPRVRASARGMAGETGVHLADDLLADLYGVEERNGRRRSLFDYFHGRSRLTTWLRTVLAQRHVDRLRETRRMVSFDDHAGGGASGGGLAAAGRQAGRGRDLQAVEAQAALAVDRDRVLAVFQHELERAVDRLPPLERLRLAYYYGQALTLAQIGRLMGEHESSVSRKLERSRQQLRAAVIDALSRTHRFSQADLRQCLDEVAGSGTLELASLLDGRPGQG